MGMKMSGIPLTIKLGFYMACYYVGTTLVTENDTICNFAAQQKSAVQDRILGPNPYRSTGICMRVSSQVKRLEARLAACEPYSEDALALQEEIAALKRKGFLSIISNKIC